MVPGRRPRRLDQRPRVLDRHGLPLPHARLLHRLAEQPPLWPRAGPLQQPQRLAGVAHALLHAHHLPGAGLLAPALPEHPRAVHDPVPQVALARHAQRGRRLRGRIQECHHARDLGVQLRVREGLAPPGEGARRGRVELLGRGAAAGLGGLLLGVAAGGGLAGREGRGGGEGAGGRGGGGAHCGGCDGGGERAEEAAHGEGGGHGDGCLLGS